jgi:hypothetical protein
MHHLQVLKLYPRPNTQMTGPLCALDNKVELLLEASKQTAWSGALHICICPMLAPGLGQLSPPVPEQELRL